MNNETPICVDLDGTLIKTDMFWESAIAFCKKNPLNLFAFLYFLLQGKAHAKRVLAHKCPIRAELLPYNQNLISFLKNKSKMHRLYLTTGADALYANQIAKYLGGFEKTFASDGERNLTSNTKKKLLVEEFGEGNYIYIGNSKDDLPIWESSKQAIFTNASTRVVKAIKKLQVACEEIPFKQGTSFSLIIRQMRVYQWVKNSLLFLPMITAHNFSSCVQVFYAFIAFSLFASSIYVVNDLCDLESDRLHPTKKNRPIASGELSISSAFLLVILLISLGGFISSFLPQRYFLTVLLYGALNVGYNLVLKAKAIVDLICLAGFYLIRILAGHEAAHLEVSYWLMTFALFFFFSLALVKRYTEFLNQPKYSSRGYSSGDLTFLGILGICSGALSILILTLYINSGNVCNSYSSPEYLWFIVPFLFYWISRVWLLAFRKQMNGDPILFALKDRVSYCTVLSLLTIIYLAC